MRFRWLVGMVLVGGGVIAVSWGVFDVVQIGECGGEDTPACPPEAIAPIGALVVGLMAAISGAVLSRSGRLLTALFGLILATGALAVYLSLNGPGAEPGVDAGPLGQTIPALFGAFGALILLIAAKPKPPVWQTGGAAAIGAAATTATGVTPVATRAAAAAAAEAAEAAATKPHLLQCGVWPTPSLLRPRTRSAKPSRA